MAQREAGFPSGAELPAMSLQNKSVVRQATGFGDCLSQPLGCTDSD